MPAAATKPKLAQLTTPVTATFPSQLSALSAASTPLSAVHPFIKQEDGAPSLASALKTPISPPTAYTEFLKAMTLPLPPKDEMCQSPAGAAPGTTTATTTSSSSSCHSSTASATSSGERTPDSAPSTASSTSSTCAQRDAEFAFPKTASTKATTPGSAIPPSPFSRLPTSAPVTGTSFPGLHIPASPAVSNCYPLDSPLSAHTTAATPTTARSPFSARSVGGRTSHFDWDAALRARAAMENSKASKQVGRTSVRHIREVVTRTVTYTPKMAPAPKGKRRKVE